MCPPREHGHNCLERGRKSQPDLLGPETLLSQLKQLSGFVDVEESAADRESLDGSLPVPTTVDFVAEDQGHGHPAVEVTLKFARLLDQLAVNAAEKLAGAVRHDDVHRFPRRDLCKRDLWISSIFVVTCRAKSKHKIVILLAKREVSLVGVF